jgi:hypothetical protein
MAEDKRNPVKGGLEFDELAGGGFGGFKGGKPSGRSAEPPPSKMELRREQRRSAFEETQAQGIAERDQRRAARKESFKTKTPRVQRFNKGGMIRGHQCRDYGK